MELPIDWRGLAAEVTLIRTDPAQKRRNSDDHPSLAQGEGG